MLHSKSRSTISLIIGIFLLGGCMGPIGKSVTPAWKEANIAFLSMRPVQAEAGTLYSTYTVLLSTGDGKDVAQLDGGRNVRKYRPVWSPDGMTLAITAYDKTQKSACLKLITQVKSGCRVPRGAAPSWSPDGKWLAFSTESDTTGPAKLNLYDLATGAIKELVEVDDPQGTAVFSSWSPTNSQLAYSDSSKPLAAIWLFDIKSGQKKYLTTGDGPAWAPDGKLIAFQRDDDIWVHDVSTGEERILIDDPVLALWPTWSPDGKSLLFQSFRDGNGEVYRLNLDTGELKNLTNNPDWDGAPSWRPEVK